MASEEFGCHRLIQALRWALLGLQGLVGTGAEWPVLNDYLWEQSVPELLPMRDRLLGPFVVFLEKVPVRDQVDLWCTMG